MGTVEQVGDLRERYLAVDETVAKVSRGDTRAFLVTDRRVLDITAGQTADGQPIEEVESTLFTDVAGVDLRIAESFEEIDGLRRLVGAVLGIFGFLLLLTGVVADLGEVSSLLAIFGLLCIGGGIWLWLTATETTPGGIRIRFRYPAGAEATVDRYLLPENQQGTARVVVEKVGEVHDPDG